MVDAADSKSVVERRVGSSPTWGTIFLYADDLGTIILFADDLGTIPYGIRVCGGFQPGSPRGTKSPSGRDGTWKARETFADDEESGLESTLTEIVINLIVAGELGYVSFGRSAASAAHKSSYPEMAAYA